jgi:hypothetical protein
MTRADLIAQLRDNPERQRAVYGDVTKSGGYFAALAVRTPCGIVSAVIEFPTQKNIAWMLRGVLHGLENGEEPREAARRFIEIENLAMASTMEAVDSKGLSRKKREVDFEKKQARAPDLLGVD